MVCFVRGVFLGGRLLRGGCFWVEGSLGRDVSGWRFRVGGELGVTR